MIKFLLIIIFSFLSSCTSVELAANLGKKVFLKKDQPNNSIAIYKIGNPYVVDGKRYYPNKNLNYDEKGIASWYGPKFHGKLTANGEIFNQYQITAAHKTLPIPSAVKVTNLKNNLSLIVRINDRGPFVNDRIIDLSYASAKKLKLINEGTGYVRVQFLRSESLLLEKYAKIGKFLEIDEIIKETTPPVKQVNYTNVSITNLNNKNTSEDKNLNEFEKKIKILEAKVQTLNFKNSKFKIWIQIASFSSKESAKILKKKFKNIKKINIHKIKNKNKTFYRVRVGPFKNIKEAKKDYKYLINNDMQGTKILIE